MENNRCVGETQNGADQGEPWCGLLSGASPRDHIVQLYQDQQFLNRAVCRFAAAAIADGEGVILVPTVAHWDAFRPRLESEGVDVKAAEKRGQLTIVDAGQSAAHLHAGRNARFSGILGVSCERDHTSPRRRSLPESTVVG